jgi:hypothetical protein
VNDPKPPARPREETHLEGRCVPQSNDRRMQWWGGFPEKK